VADLIIDPEIRADLPAPLPEELELLEKSILAEGCRDVLVVWKGHSIILDGHNRYEICSRLGVPFRYIEMEFGSHEEALLWVANNQLGRRNLTEYQKKILIGKKLNLQKKLEGRPAAAKLPQSEGVSGETAERIAQEQGFSRATIERSADLYRSHQAIQEQSPETAQKLVTGEIRAPEKDICLVGRILRDTKGKRFTPEQRADVAAKVKEDFKEAVETAKEIAKPLAPKLVQESEPEPEEDGGFIEIELSKPATYQGAAESKVIDLTERMRCPTRAPLLTETQKKEAEDLAKLVVNMPPVPRVMSNLAGIMGILQILDDIDCPKCGTPGKGNLVWRCCQISMEEAYAIGDKAEDDHLAAAARKSRERREREAQMQGAS
jgi:hypothetical protein